MQGPQDRIGLEGGGLESLVQRVATEYRIGEVSDFSVIEVGYEDCNVIISTDEGRFMAKMFAKKRKPEEIDRYVGIMQHVVDAGVHHPELMKLPSGNPVFAEYGVSLVLMRFVEGQTFFELDRAPTADERLKVLEQAAKVNAIKYEPPYLFDSWAIPNIHTMFERVKQYIKPEDLELVQQAIAAYEAIPVADLPHCFVHGDLTKANVLKSGDGVYFVDFSVANKYPRIQELAVIAANLLHNEDAASLADRCQQAADEYSRYMELMQEEREHLPAYALAAVCMEFMGSHQEKFINGNNNEETEYWLNLGRQGLKRELA